MAAILAFQQPRKVQGWTNEELAELFRVVDILGRAGVPIDTDVGLSDEGEPWFVFCRADTGDVIVHFSRIDGQFVAVSAATDAVVRGDNFRRVAERLVNRQPLILPPPSSGQKLFLHPSVVLTALVATTLAQMKSWEGQQIAASDDVTDGVADIVSETTFSETLKTAFMDALNLVLRGFTGPMETRNAPGEHAQLAAPGFGLGNLSLASVVAFAISAIQGSPLQDETDIAGGTSRSSGAGEAATKNAAGVIGAIQVAENKAQEQTGAQERVAESKESGTTKAAARDVAVSGALEKAGDADKSDVAATDVQNFVIITHKEPADKLVSADAGTGIIHEKLLLADISADAPTAQSAHYAAAVAEQKEVTPPDAVAVRNSVDQHRISFTEISKEAIEIFFVRLASDSSRDVGEKSVAASPITVLNNESREVSGTGSGRTALNASDIVFAGGDPVTLARLNMITDFVYSANNTLTAPASLPEALKNYWTGNTALTVVVFDSNDLPLNIFSFTNNVLFVEESQFAGTTTGFGNSSLHVDLANGGDVTLLGVINLNPLMAA